MVNKKKIQHLIDQNQFNEALMIIYNLENTNDIDLENSLTLEFLKCQILANIGKTIKGLELADKALIVARNQVPKNQQLLVEAINTKAETLRKAEQFTPTYSRQRLMEYLQLLEEGEQIIGNISDSEPIEITEQRATLYRNKGLIYSSLRKLDYAEKCLQESIAHYKKIGNPKKISEILVDLAEIFGIKNEYKNQLEILNDCLNLCEELQNREGIVETLWHFARAYQRKGEPETASVYIQRSLQLVNQLPRTKQVASLLFRIGDFYFNFSNENVIVLDAYQKSLSISEELDDKEGIQFCLHLLGDLHQYTKGDLNKALEYYERSMGMFKEVGVKIVHAWNLLDIGNLYHLKGDVDRALICFQKALPILEEINDDFYFCQTFLHIGRVYRTKGDTHSALNYYKRCLKLLREKKLLAGQETEGLAYYEIITIMLDINNVNEAKKYFGLFTQYYERKEVIKQFLNQWYKLAEALILKTSNRIKDKALAQRLFQEIIDDPYIKLNLLNYLADSKRTAMLNLCELLLFEIKLSPNETIKESEVFQELKQRLNNFASLAYEQNIFPLYVDVTILKAKLALIDENLTEAMQLLIQAKNIAEKNDLQFLYKRVVREEKQIKKQLSLWENLIRENSPLLERLAQAQIEEYILKVKRIINLPDEL